LDGEEKGNAKEEEPQEAASDDRKECVFLTAVTYSHPFLLERR